MSLAKLRLMNEMELMMKRKDIFEFKVVFALYTISHCSDMMFDEIDECDLPESLRGGYRSVRSSISELVDSLDRYGEDKMETLIAACED